MDIRKSYVIDAPRDAVWAALTKPEVIDRWGGGPVVMKAEPGFVFSFWGGDIHGVVREVEPGVCMVQDWYGGDWLAPSVARFTLSDEPGGSGTLLEFENTGVPEADVASIDAGWDDYYFGPLRALLEESAE
jgi:uncharacterized protein YndB with AHSA1/START domain